MGMRDYKSPTLSAPCFPPAFSFPRVVQTATPETSPWRSLTCSLFGFDWSLKSALASSWDHLLVPHREVIEKAFIFNVSLVFRRLNSEWVSLHISTGKQSITVEWKPRVNKGLNHAHCRVCQAPQRRKLDQRSFSQDTWEILMEGGG